MNIFKSIKHFFVKDPDEIIAKTISIQQVFSTYENNYKDIIDRFDTNVKNMAEFHGVSYVLTTTTINASRRPGETIISYVRKMKISMRGPRKNIKLFEESIK